MNGLQNEIASALLDAYDIRNALPEHIKRFKGWAVNSDYRAWDRKCCGMHIHIDSHAFTQMTLGRRGFLAAHDWLEASCSGLARALGVECGSAPLRFSAHEARCTENARGKTARSGMALRVSRMTPGLPEIRGLPVPMP